MSEFCSLCARIHRISSPISHFHVRLGLISGITARTAQSWFNGQHASTCAPHRPQNRPHRPSGCHLFPGAHQRSHTRHAHDRPAAPAAKYVARDLRRGGSNLGRRLPVAIATPLVGHRRQRSHRPRRWPPRRHHRSLRRQARAPPRWATPPGPRGPHHSALLLLPAWARNIHRGHTLPAQPIRTSPPRWQAQ